MHLSLQCRHLAASHIAHSRSARSRLVTMAGKASKLMVGGHVVEGISIAGQENFIVLPQQTLWDAYRMHLMPLDSGASAFKHAQETSIVLPSANVVFDTGRCPQRSVFAHNVLITHCHLDHLGGLPHHIASRQMQKLPPTQAFVPPSMLAQTEALLAAYRAFEHNDMPCDVHGIAIGEDRRIGSWTVRPFATCHTVASQGYLLSSKRQKLKPEWQGRPGAEIKAAKLAGEEITQEVTVPEIAFTGDTTTDWISMPGNEEVLKAKLLIMELTFLDDAVSAEHARKHGHTHIDELVQHADRFQNKAILLMHISARYSRGQVVRLLDEKLPPELHSRCTPMLEGW